MNGGHDLGGKHGFGNVNPERESEETVFHSEWERRAFAVTLACGFLGRWNIDEARHARESQNPSQYLSNTYYENWLAGLETLLVAKGLVSREELNSGKSQNVADNYSAPNVTKMRGLLATGTPSRLRDSRSPIFQLGDEARVSKCQPLSHTRVPGYARGCVGTIARLHGVYVFPDDNARGNSQGEYLYSVQFKSDELWGINSHGVTWVYIDLWEPYLHPE